LASCTTRSSSRPRPYTREAYLRELLVEGLHRRYGLRAASSAIDFVVDAVEAPERLPTYVAAPDASAAEAASPADTAARRLLDRLNHELKVIEKTGFVSYFLIVGDFVRYGRSKRRLVRGARLGRRLPGHLPARDLHVDPLRYGLLFETVSQSERISPPGH